MTTLHLACAADEGYARHSAVMIRSALANRGPIDLVFHYLHGPRLDAGVRARLAAMVEGERAAIVFHAISDERVAGLPEMVAVSRTMWYRLWLPELVPGAERVLYLDIDTLVLDSLEPLTAIDLAGHHLAAVANVWEPWNAEHPSGLGIPASQPYFNSGVLLMNLALMRETGSTEMVRRFAVDNPEKLAWPDQDALNVVLGPTHLELHPRWNCMNSVLMFQSAAEVFGPDATAEARSNPAIRHFEGPSVNKPWHALADRRSRKLYRHYRLQTPWPHYLPDGLTAANLVRLLLRSARQIRRP